MNQAKFDKRLKTLSKKFFGKCTYCRKPYPDSCHTFSGFDDNGNIQDVGNCCKHKLSEFRAAGVYLAADSSTPEGMQIYNQLVNTHPLRMHFSTAR